ncbi:restriction endonuclease subunit S [Constantimarinum furrinae]|uniref:Type I restriction enzyme, S subunit n=1 Tax=Constantimarinum furrinae TaxID=2562285 RepID=A0A7G8PRR1_9FLAO|nr:restriction endonuclease subunit S [Constantimarinum furrinae]QNJ97027.1 type I restriction enzyme, S subunit [Constantimarinum furrinae]
MINTTATNIETEKEVSNERNIKVPALRFNEFEEIIEESLFGNHYTFHSTNSLSRDKLNYNHGEVRNIHYGDIHTKFQTHFYLVKEHVPFINDDVDLARIKEDSYCKVGDLVIADASEDYADIGKCIELIDINNERLLAGLHTFLARPSQESTSLGYMSFLLKSWKLRRQIMTIAQGTKVLSLSTGRVSKLKLNLPSLPEQQKIASFLSSVDQKIQQLTTKKELLEQYKKGVMQKLFSRELRFKDKDGKAFPEWEEKYFKDIVIKYRLGGNYTNTEEETIYPLIKMGNLGRGTMNTKKLDYIPIDEEIDPKDKIRYGDLFFNTRNTLELVGKVSIWRNELPIAYYNSNLMYLKFDDNFFMNYRLNSYEGIKGLKRFATGTTSVAAIYTKDLLKLKLNIPCLEEQKKIATYLSSIDSKIENVNNQITLTQTFKKGLLQQMFV